MVAVRYTSNPDVRIIVIARGLVDCRDSMRVERARVCSVHTHRGRGQRTWRGRAGVSFGHVRKRPVSSLDRGS